MTKRGFSGLGEGGANNFDAIRFALATLVVGSHSFPLLQGDNRHEPLAMLTGEQASFGQLAVDGFFLISGFLITRSWLRNASAGAYLKRRVLRIYPGFLVATILGTVAFGPIVATASHEYWQRFDPSKTTRSALVLQAVYPSAFDDLPYAALNGSLWTIPYEFQCYLGVMVLGWLGFWRGRRAPAIALTAVLAIYFAQAIRLGPGGNGLVAGNPWPRFAACFLAGAWFQIERERVPRSASLFAIAAAGLVVLGALPSWNALPVAVPLLGGYALFYLASMPVTQLQTFARRGDYSYGLYLYAFPVQQSLVRVFGASRLTPLSLFALAFPVSLLLAIASWRLVEAPFLRRKVESVRFTIEEREVNLQQPSRAA